MCVFDFLQEVWSNEQTNFMTPCYNNIKWRHKICFRICMQRMLIVQSRYCINSSYKKAWYDELMTFDVHAACLNKWLLCKLVTWNFLPYTGRVDCTDEMLHQLITLWRIKRTNRGSHTRVWYDELRALTSMLSVWKNDSCLNLMKLVMGWLYLRPCGLFEQRSSVPTSISPKPYI